MKADFTNYKSLMSKLLKIMQKDTCLLTVDMQNEYLDPKVGTSPLAKSEVDRILKNSNFINPSQDIKLFGASTIYIAKK